MTLTETVDVYPAVGWEGERIVEAVSYDMSRLPHQYPGFREMFPQAKAAPETCDQDPPEDDSLERHGNLIGKGVIL